MLILTKNGGLKMNEFYTAEATPINETLVCLLTKDKMTGIISFSEPSNGGSKLSESQIRQIIASNNITHGINEELLTQLSKEHEYDFKYIIASGTLPIHGEDGRIEVCVDLPLNDGNIRLKENQDGSVNFKSLGIISNVKKGTLLAKKVLPTQAIDGINVCGTILKAKNGKEVHIKKGKNVTLSDDGLLAYAAIDGQPCFENNILDVLRILTISGSVDASVGNVDFLGDVIVEGNVNTGYSITSGGNIEIKGSVEACTLIAKGNIVLRYGIQGSNSGKLVAGKNVIAKFIENCTVEAGQDIVAESVIQSNIVAGNIIQVTKGKGNIIGGEILATSSIFANVIGGQMETPTTLKIGIPVEILQRNTELLQELKTKNKQLSELSKNIVFLFEKNKHTSLSDAKLELLNRLSLNKNTLELEIKELRKEATKLSSIIERHSKGRIVAYKSIFPGTRIYIGNTYKRIHDKCESCSVRAENAQIIID